MQRRPVVIMLNRPWLTLGAAIAVGVMLAACVGPGSSGGPSTADQAAKLALSQQARFTGIGPRDDNLIGQAAWYEVEASGNGWQVKIRIGWGDCPSGCIHERRWIYTVGRDGSVKLASEDGDTLPGKTGISGIATAGPTCPVVTASPSPACADRPVDGAVLVIVNLQGSEVARAVTGSDGRFSVELAPGAYRLIPQPVQGLMGTATPIDLRVDAEAPVTDIQVSYDTGIR